MTIFQLRRGKITQGSRTKEPWFILNILCFELRWHYPHSSAWMHWYLKVSLLGFEWFPWKKTERNSHYEVDTSNGYFTTTPFFSGPSIGPLDPEEMKAEYDSSGPHDLTPFAKAMGMDVIYNPESPNYKKPRPRPWEKYLYDRQRQSQDANKPKRSGI